MNKTKITPTMVYSEIYNDFKKHFIEIEKMTEDKASRRANIKAVQQTWNLYNFILKKEKEPSKNFKKAIKNFKSRENIIIERMKDVKKNGKDALLDFDELLKNRKKD